MVAYFYCKPIHFCLFIYLFISKKFVSGLLVYLLDLQNTAVYDFFQIFTFQYIFKTSLFTMLSSATTCLINLRQYHENWVLSQLSTNRLSIILKV